MNQGKSFEDLVGAFYKELLANNPDHSVKMRDRMDTRYGVREFDISIRSRIADIDILTIIECKDYKRLVDIPLIDAFQSKINDAGASKGVMVSRKGFTRSAIKKASDLKIDVYRIDAISEFQIDADWNLPVLFRKIEIESFSLTIKPIKTGQDSSVQLDPNKLVNDLSVFDLMALIDPNELILSRYISLDIAEALKDSGIWMRHSSGEKRYLEKCVLEVKMDSPILFCYLLELPSTIIKRDEARKDVLLRCDFNDLFNIRKLLTSFDHPDLVPTFIRKQFLSVVAMPKELFGVSSIKMFKEKHGTSQNLPPMIPLKNPSSTH